MDKDVWQRDCKSWNQSIRGNPQGRGAGGRGNHNYQGRRGNNRLGINLNNNPRENNNRLDIHQKIDTFLVNIDCKDDRKITQAIQSLNRDIKLQYDNAQNKQAIYNNLVVPALEKLAGYFISNPKEYNRLKYFPLEVRKLFINEYGIEIIDDVYKLYFEPIKKDFSDLTFYEEKSLSIWKDKLLSIEFILTDFISNLFKVGNKENSYNKFVEPIMKELAKAFLIKPLDHVKAKFTAISICEQILWQNLYVRLPEVVLAKLYYHLANFHSHSEHEVWRSSVYRNALEKIQKSNPEVEEYQTLSSIVQKSSESSSTGLHRLTEQYVSSSLEENSDLKVESENDIIPIRKITGLTGQVIDWSNVALFSVLTGVNGSRKTILLNAIHKYLRQKSLEQFSTNLDNNFYALHIKSEVTGDRKVHGEKSYDFIYSYILEALEILPDFRNRANRNNDEDRKEQLTRLKILNDIGSNFNYRVAVSIFDRILTKEVSMAEAKTSKYITEVAEIIIFSENLLSEPVTLVENIYKQYLNLFIDEYLFSEDEQVCYDAVNFLLEKTSQYALNPPLENGPNFQKTIEIIFDDKWIEERKIKYNRMLLSRELDKYLNHIASYLNTNREKYHLWCEEYLKKHDRVSPVETLSRIFNIVINYQIKFDWRKTHARGNYLRLETPPKNNLDRNIIYIYQKEENGLWFYRSRSMETEDELGIDLSNIVYTDGITKTVKRDETVKVYEAISKRGLKPIGKYRLEVIKNSVPIGYNSLSSGELMLVKLSLWALLAKGINYGSVNNKVKILLLDEIDKHLDSKLIKSLISIIHEEFVASGVQVFMTTHRPDTLSLVNRNDKAISKKAVIFTMKYEPDVNQLFFYETHPFLAMLRLSRNLREITNFHIRTYTEASDDMRFFEGVHKVLLRYCEKVKEVNRYKVTSGKILDFESRYWPDLYLVGMNSWKNRLLSKRYQPLFVSSAASKDRGGGKSAIKDILPREIAAKKKQSEAYVKKINPVELIDPKVEIPFAIMDNDYGNKNREDVEKNSILKDLIVFLTRHSLENHFWDPWIIFSLISIEDGRSFFNENSIFYQSIEYINQLKNGEIIYLSKNPLSIYIEIFLKELLNNLHELEKALKSTIKICQIITQLNGDDLFQAMISDLTTAPEYMFKLIGEELGIKKDIYSKYEKYGEISKEGQVNYLSLVVSSYKSFFKIERDQSISVEEIISCLMIDCEEIDVIYDPLRPAIKFHYPKLFLTLRGHDIEDILLKRIFTGDNYDGQSFKNFLITKIYNTDSLCIPKDLLQVFFELNYKIRKQIYPVIKNTDLDKKENELISDYFLNLAISAEEHKNADLRKAEKITFRPYVNGLNKLLIPYVSKSLNFISPESNFNIGSKTITVFPEEDHIKDHENNILKLSGYIKEGNVLCLERKEKGNNLGMPDVKALADYIKQGNIIPEWLKKMPIYHDAILYNSANGKVLGIEGKSLPNDETREIYMFEQLVEITNSGKNPVVLVGSSHTKTLLNLFIDKGFEVVRDSNPIILTAKTSYFNININWDIQKLIHYKDMWEYESIRQKYGITAPFDIFRQSDSLFKKEILLKVHPDKNPGKANSAKDFAFINNLREKMSQDFDFANFLNQKIQPLMYKANTGFKFADIMIDVTRIVYFPNYENAKKILFDVAYLYSIYSGINGFSAVIGGYNILDKIYQGEYYQAGEQALTTASFMFVPTALSYAAIPYTGFIYLSGMTIYGGYSMASNAYNLYQELDNENLLPNLDGFYGDILI